MKKISILVTTLLLLTNFAFSQAKIVDNFINGDDSIAVYFYDPLLSLNKVDKDFQSKTDKEKSDALNKYLHENPRLRKHAVKLCAKCACAFLCESATPQNCS